MHRAEILAAVRERIGEMKGLHAVQFLDDEWREKLKSLEHQAEKDGAVGGLMRVINKGVRACFKRQEQMVIVVDKDAIILSLTNNLLQISDQDGHIIGEWINKANEPKDKEDPDEEFVSQDFVLYPDKEIHGEPFFVLPEVDFPFLYGAPGIRNVTSGSVSGLTGDYIMKRLATVDRDFWTHLVGFDLVTDSGGGDQ